MKGKPVKESAIENQVYKIFPNDLNPQGNIFGGRVLELIDMLGGIVAMRHSEKICVTASMDSIDFIAPAKSGDLLIFKAAFVSLNDDGKPTSVPKIVPKTKQEKRRFREAEERRAVRLARKQAREGKR